MTHFASELRQNPKTRLRSVLLRLRAGPTTGSGRPEPEIRTGGPRSQAPARATRPLLWSLQPRRRRRAPPRLQRHRRLLALHLPSASAGPTSSSASAVVPGRPRAQPSRRNRWSRRRRAGRGAGLSWPVASRKGKRGRTPAAWAFNGEDEAGGVASSSSCEAGPRRRARGRAEGAGAGSGGNIPAVHSKAPAPRQRFAAAAMRRMPRATARARFHRSRSGSRSSAHHRRRR